jgi:Na+-transporting NADH:ubiquinone oxidoreductase subunit NqrB
MSTVKSLFGDARHFQIAALATLLVLNLTTLDFGASLVPSGVAIASCLATQALCTRIFGLPHFDFRSPLITGFSLSLLLRADALWIYALGGLLAIGSKFLIRYNGKHLFNPATFAIVALMYTTHRIWVTPGQWGTEIWLGALMTFFAILVLHSAARIDIALAFIGTWVALLVGRALWLGDPLTIPLHQVQSGSLLLFTFFMITDPRSTPDAMPARIIFAVAVAAVAFWLLFFQQMRPALYVSLAAMHLLVPVLDRLFPHERFEWRRPVPVGSSA